MSDVRATKFRYSPTVSGHVFFCVSRWRGNRVSMPPAGVAMGPAPRCFLGRIGKNAGGRNTVTGLLAGMTIASAFPSVVVSMAVQRMTRRHPGASSYRPAGPLAPDSYPNRF